MAIGRYKGLDRLDQFRPLIPRIAHTGTYEYTVVTYTKDKLNMKPTRRVLWDGVHSQDRATWPVESCASIRATYPLTENVGEIPDYMRTLQR
jgi:hypothetical protein